MEDAALGNPSLQERAKSLPPHLCSLAAPDENTSPQPVNTMLKDAQLSRVTRDSMVLVVAQHKLAKPCTDLGRRMMLPALKFSLDGHRLRGHPPLRRNPPDDEGSIADALPTVVGETQEGKVSGFPSPRRCRFRAPPCTVIRNLGCSCFNRRSLRHRPLVC